MKNVDVPTLQQKADYFYKNNIIVHVKYRRGFWKRGYITKVSSDFFILKENFDGNIPVFFLELKDIEQFHRADNRYKNKEEEI